MTIKEVGLYINISIIVLIIQCVITVLLYLLYDPDKPNITIEHNNIIYKFYKEADLIKEVGHKQYETIKEFNKGKTWIQLLSIIYPDYKLIKNTLK